MICFILNPNSGSKSNRYRLQIMEYLKKIPTSQLFITEYPGHAKVIAQKLVEDKITNRIIAIGGDGTINEIGSSLTGTDMAMGIIPLGSGNGLARHLGISMQFNKALNQALNGHSIYIDTLTWNDKPFFCTAGIGFDSEVAQDFAKKSGRGLITYIKSTFQTITKYKSTQISINNKPTESLFSLTIANANQYGNNAFISPFSNVQDAQFEVVKIKKGNFWEICQLGISLFWKRIHKQQIVAITSTNSLEIKVAKGTAFHLDGESLFTDQDSIKIKIFSEKLKVVV
jgi:YegS/Rv2252/BmrU family lipid kinase